MRHPHSTTFFFTRFSENIGPHNECIQTFLHSYTKRTNRTQSNTTDSFPFLFIQTFVDDYKILTKPIFSWLSIMHTHTYALTDNSVPKSASLFINLTKANAINAMPISFYPDSRKFFLRFSILFHILFHWNYFFFLFSLTFWLQYFQLTTSHIFFYDIFFPL